MPLDLFSKTPLPNALPDEMQAFVDTLKRSDSQEVCLKNAYEILIKKYRGERLKTYTRLFDIFKCDPNTLWNTDGFLHCTNINYILRTVLIRSGFFMEDDIRLKWTNIWYISPHQYLQVRVNGIWISVDIWAYAYGIRFGDNAHGFH